MGVFPDVKLPPLVTIHPWSLESIGPALSTLASTAQITGSASSTLSQNRAYLFPFVLAVPWLVVKLSVLNGATANGNIDLGIYDRVFTRIVSAGSTAQVGTNAIQTVDIADTMLAPGLFYLAFATDSTTATVFANANVGNVELTAAGVVNMTAAMALPATITPAASGSARVIAMFATGRTLI